MPAPRDPGCDVAPVPFKFVQTPGLTLILYVDDPKAYTKPWSVTIGFDLLPDTDLIEHIRENEKDTPHIVGK